MRKLLCLLALASTAYLCPQDAVAQYYYIPFVSAGQNPGGLNGDPEAPQGAGLPADWTTLLSAATSVAPTWSAPQSMPFSFSFAGVNARDYVVSNTGVLTFTVAAAGGAVPASQNYLLPDPSIPDHSVCLWGLKMRAPSASNSGDFVVSKTFGNAPHRQHWVQFNSMADGGTGAGATATYWSIVLEEGSNAIYLVDQLSNGPVTLSAGVQIDATTALAVNNAANLGSRTVASADPSPADNTYYAFYPGTQPGYDMMATTLDLDPLQATNLAPFTIEGSVRNIGSQAISSYTLNYSIDGGAPVSTPITDAVAPLATRPYTHPTPWTPASAGTYTLRVWASSLNGQLDGQPANDTLTKVIAIADVAVHRRVLEECFTSSTCPPCRPGNTIVEAVNRQNANKITVVKYQQNFPAPGNDPYYTQESGNRFDYYGLSAIPYMMLDGGWGDNSNSFTAGILNSFYNKPAYLAVDAVYTVDPITRTVSAEGQLMPLADIPASDLVAHLVITEKHTRNNARTNGETDFFHVMKKMLPDENGQALPALTNRRVELVQQSYVFPAVNDVEHFDSLEVVFFVQSRLTKKIYQSISARLNGTLNAQPAIDPLGVDEARTLAAGFRVFPNPASGAGAAALALNLPAPTTVAVDVVDALGRRLAGFPTQPVAAGPQTLPLDLRGLPAGLYTVRLTRAGGLTRSTRLVVAD